MCVCVGLLVRSWVMYDDGGAGGRCRVGVDREHIQRLRRKSADIKRPHGLGKHRLGLGWLCIFIGALSLCVLIVCDY